MQTEKKVTTMDRVNKGLARRYRRERLFRLSGLSAIVATICFIGLLFFTIGANGWSAFQQTEVLLPVHFDEERFDVDNLAMADYGGLVKDAMRSLFPEVKGRTEKRKLYKLVSSGAPYVLQKMVMQDTAIIGSRQEIWLPADDEVDMFLKGHISRDVAEGDRRLSDKQIGWIDRLSAEKRLEKKFNTTFLGLEIPGNRNLPEFVVPLSARSIPWPSPFCFPFPLAWPPQSILKNLPLATDGLILLRSISIIWQPFPPSSLACWALLCFSIFSECPDPLRWWVVWC